VDTNPINYIKNMTDIDIDKHSGSYKLVREGIMRLANVSPEDIGVKDLLMLYRFGCHLYSEETRNKDIDESTLIYEDKQYMQKLNMQLSKGSYTNVSKTKVNGIGGLFSGNYRGLESKCDKDSALRFIKMLIDISKIDDLNEIMQIAAECFSNKLSGIRAEVASQFLHLLKPTVFPVFNRPNNYKKILALPLIEADELHNLIKNLKLIHEFRDENFLDKNFRTIDVALWDINLGEEKFIDTTDDKKKQRAAFKKWYISNGDSPNSINTISTAINKARLKNGKAIFAITNLSEFNIVIKDANLEGYFENERGNYNKMDDIFDVEPNTQMDDLKSGIKFYLRFLNTKNESESLTPAIQSYWLGGAAYGDGVNDVSQMFIEKGIFAIGFERTDISDIVTNPSELNDWISNIAENRAKKAFELLSQMNAGDKIAIKAAYAKGKISMLRIKAIGTILDDLENGYNFDGDLGHTIPVEWEPVTPFVDYELGGYLWTIHQVTKKEDIETIFYNVKKNLEDDFINWFITQKKSDGKPYADNYKNQIRNSLRYDCKKLKDLDLFEHNLFLQTDVKAFIELKNRIINSSFYANVDAQAGNAAFSRSLDFYEKFLIERAGTSVTAISLKEFAIKVLEDTQKPMTDIEIWEYGVNNNWDELLNSIGKTPWQSIYAILSNYKDGTPNPDKRIKIIDSEQRRKFVINSIDGEDEPTQANSTDFNYNIGISKERWMEMLDNSVIAKNDIELLRKWLYLKGQATCTEVGKTYNAHPTSYIAPVFSMSRRIHKYTNCKTRLDESGNIAWWNIPFIGKYVNGGEHFEWTIRPEFYDALLSKGITPLEPPMLVKYDKEDFLTEVYFESDDYDDIVGIISRKMNIILQGAPGVGKSYMAKRLAYSIVGVKDENKIEMIQFHQNYSYEDFIEGFRPNEDGKFIIKKGVFYNFCEKAKYDKDNKYFFIIDEINRGNLSKVMGELMLLLEHDKRGDEFEMSLTYSGDKFYVPENVYVIGMMNTADRSLAMIDYALRRRFSFIPIEPVFENLQFIADFKANYPDAETIIEKIKKLNIFISENLDNGHQIGHSYFCSNSRFTSKDIEGIIKYEITELLKEYFFDDTEAYNKAKDLLP
jgi:5-methylcytosine-specific restriction protein B